MVVASGAALAAVAVLSFVLGSIPWGIVIGKLFFHQDIRAVGSGNIGTTNAMRALGKKGGAAVFVLDFGKGVVAGLLTVMIGNLALDGSAPFAGTLATPGDLLGMAFFCCIAGHVFSPWLGFHGGKGIAVAAGAMVWTFGLPGFGLELALFIVLVLVTRYVSLGSVAAAVLCVGLSFYFYWGDWPAWALCTAGALLVIWAHRENLHRLASGTERRVGDKKEA